MFGPSFLINPVTKYKARKRNVYLPSGIGWYDLKSGKYFKGGETIQADAPYTDIPVFVKEGSIIPCGPALQYSTEKPADPIRLFIYTGNDCSFNLYEDENTNYNYEKGMFSIIPLKYNEKNHEIILGNRQGEFPGMLKARTFEIKWIGKENPSGLKIDSIPDSVINYDGTQQIIKMK